MIPSNQTTQVDFMDFHWIDIINPTPQFLSEIATKYELHLSTVQDCLMPDHLPKFEDYDNYVVAIMKMLYYETELQSEQLSVVLMDGLVISFQEAHGGDAFDLIRNRIRLGKGRIRKMGADYLAYALIDAVVDCYFDSIEKIGDKVEKIEEEIIHEPKRESLIEL